MVTPRRSTLAEQAYEELQEKIVSGELPAGRRLLAEELAGELAISPTPVKEALVRLAQNGFVDAPSRRASVVRRYTVTDIREIYDARLLIEGHAVESAMRAGRIDAAFVEQLDAIVARQIEELNRKTSEGLDEAIRLDREFHGLLANMGDNRLLASWHGIVLLQTQTIRNYSLSRYALERVRREHGEIVAAISSGDPQKALAAIRSHLMASCEEFTSRPPEDLPVRT
jgi:DNA-binding GntR family transcriptional regulator